MSFNVPVAPHEQCKVCGHSLLAINHRDKHWIHALIKWLVPAEMSVCSPLTTYPCLQHNLPMPLKKTHTHNREHPGTEKATDNILSLKCTQGDIYERHSLDFGVFTDTSMWIFVIFLRHRADKQLSEKPGAALNISFLSCQGVKRRSHVGPRQSWLLLKWRIPIFPHLLWCFFQLLPHPTGQALSAPLLQP